MRLSLTRALLLTGAIFVSVPASAQMDSREGIALQNQILELRRDMQQLQSQVGRGGVVAPAPGGSSLGGAYGSGPAMPPPGGDMTAQLLQRVQALEEQVRSLRGQVEEIANQTQRQNAEMAKQIGDLNFQLQQGGRSTGAAPPPAAPPRTASPPPANLGGAPANPPPAAASGSPARRTPELALQEGHAALARRDYPAAEAAAREVLQGSRTSPRAYDAQFLLAQALAGQRNYAQAAIAYDDTYNRSKTGGHAPDALLGLANALTGIGEKRAACETLSKLAAEFPRSSEAREGAPAVRQRAGCR
ncbi:MAG: tetratricopeptide repeat protein [Alphaproteobacteria bacterium]|nr:tetratricopeptide repeat protein [Rhodospirillales bacterium]MBN9561200.1 tetratricopeptide repeat protein [Alphaproteobacteria bacterium]